MKKCILITLLVIMLSNTYCIELQRDYFKQVEFIKNLGSNFTTTTIGKVKYNEITYPVYKITFNPNGKKKYLILCGVHGNEPAPIFAIGEYIQALNRKTIDINTPCIDFVYIVNPWGFSYNQRYNAVGIDINRDMTTEIAQESKILRNSVSMKIYDRVFDFHEGNTKGYYLYYYSTKQKKIVDELLMLYEKYNLPLEDEYKDVVLKAKKGVIYVPWYAKAYMKYKNTITTALWSYNEGVNSSFTIETSKNRDIEERKKIIKNILDYIMVMDS